MKVPEPRDISVAFSIAYVLAFLGGLATLILPPRSIAGVVGPSLMVAIGVFFIAGSVLGMYSGAKEIWLLERVAIWLMGGGLLAYGAQVGILHFTSSGSRLTQLTVVGIALTLFVVRYLMIRKYTYRPRG